MNLQTIAPIVQTITIDAPAQRVFDALTKPEELTKWWGSDDSYRCAEMTVDLRPGGAWRTTGKDAQGKPFSVEGVYREIAPPHLVEFTWRHDYGQGESVETIVRYELVERDGQTHLTLTHSGFTSVDDRDDHHRGWQTVMQWLRGYVR